MKLEEHYGKPQDIEFAMEDEEVYIVQSRPITTLKAVKQTGKINAKSILDGLGASPGISVGTVKLIKSMSDLPKIKKGDVLVTEMTNPDMVVSMEKSSAIVTDEGGMTSHAAIVSREMGIPAVVGTGEATNLLKDGMRITVDGTTGKVYEGEVAETKLVEIKEALPVERIKLKVLADLPEGAERAAKTGLDAVGLMRLEGVIASSSKHPLLYEKEGNVEDYIKLIENGVEAIAEHFNMVWIRSSDIRTDEYSTLEGAPEREINPMLGLHGIRFSLKHPKLFEAELEAIKRVSEKYPNKKLGIMFPQIISIEEVKQARVHFDKFKTPNMQFGVMIETPAAVQIIEEICQEGVDFISFGTNDLTQFTLGVDRGEDQVQHLYNEFHPAVFSQIKRVIGACRRNKVETSICGQAGSRKEMVEFLFKKGISSISVNADAAYDISVLLRELEGTREKIISGKDIQNSNNQSDQNSNNKGSQSNHPNNQNNNPANNQMQDNEKKKIIENNSNNIPAPQYKQASDRQEYLNNIPNNQQKIPLPKLTPDSKPIEIKTYKQIDEELEKQASEVYIKGSEPKIREVDENIGPIEPLDNTDRIENITEDIQEEVKNISQEALDKQEKREESFERVEQRTDNGVSGAPDSSNDVGVYNPQKEEQDYPAYNYNFEEDEDSRYGID